MWLCNQIKYLLNRSMLVLILIYLSTIVQAENSTPEQLVGWKQEMIKIEKVLSSQDNIREHIIINTYIADTPIKRTQGLMHVTDLNENEGMLFIFNPPRHVSMWMKDTVISLDILFIKADGTIAHVHKEAKPLSLRSIPSMHKVKWVLELKAGVTEKLKLRPGHKLIRD
ncbi:MAG: hypothetical protein CMD78_04945 [Gammaproteobacteria bacterium]|nr:hypothetical protein [Gammaproteobacteria bacterium]